MISLQCLLSTYHVVWLLVLIGERAENEINDPRGKGNGEERRDDLFVITQTWPGGRSTWKALSVP